MTTKENKQNEHSHTCGERCEVWSRVCGYFRPVSSWNKGKKQEFNERRTFVIKNDNANN